MTDDKIELTRRKILGSVGAVGAAGAAAGLGTGALLSDGEGFDGNSITAGTLDMLVDAKVPAGGINDEWAGAVGFAGYDPPTTNGGAGTGITLGDMKPGDWVLLCYQITVRTNPACLSLAATNTANDENSVTEPEADTEDGISGTLDNANTTPDPTGDIDGQGELAQNIEVTVYDDFDESATSLGGDLASAESALSNELLGGVTLDEVWGTFAGPEGAAIATDTTGFDFYLLLELPVETGNEVQSDSVEWDFVFDAVQSRNNECATPVWEADAFSISASPSGANEADSIHRIEIPVGPDLDGETLSSLTVDYPDDFGISDVGTDDVLGAGVQQTDSSITPLTVSGVSISSIEFSLDGSVSVSTGETIFIQYEDVQNPSAPGDYTVVVDVNGSEVGTGTLTVTSESQTLQPVTSTFDVDDEGWEITGDAQGGSAVPTYKAGTGNPAPSIFAKDDVQGGVWYFKAPGKFLGDKSGFYGGTLQYDLRADSDKSNQFDARDIILEGAGMELRYDHGGTSTHPPDGSFKSYTVTLDESDSWKKDDGSTATQNEVQSVLGDLTRLRIRGEYESGPDEGYLDNAVLVPPSNQT